MNTTLWIAQSFLALLFLYSGICKATLPEPKLVAMGQTGVAGLASPFIKFIGLSELLGVAGLLLPQWLHIAPVLTPVAAFCLGLIMLPAARIHYKRGELSTAGFNIFVLVLCVIVGVERWQTCCSLKKPERQECNNECRLLKRCREDLNSGLHLQQSVSMNAEMVQIAGQLNEAYEGDPWFGKNAKTVLAEAEAVAVFQKPNGQHSIAELLWHITTWREFTLTRLQPQGGKDTHYFEQYDWRPIDASNSALWHEGLKKLDDVHNELMKVLQQQQDSRLMERVPDRAYTFRKLLYGVVQHDIYHLGQIAYITKLLKG